MKDKYQKMLDNFLTIKEASEKGIPLATIYHAKNYKGLKVYMIGKTQLVLKKDIEKMIRGRK